LDRRRADGTPLLLFTVLAVLTGVGLARVDSRIEILDLANEITELSEDQQRLLDRKRRLETERAYLRRPARVEEQARERLNMAPAPPERIQPIELEPAPEPEPEPDPRDQDQDRDQQQEAER
jgi:cell division protein FtsL